MNSSHCALAYDLRRCARRDCMISNIVFALLMAAPAQTGTIQGTVFREGTSVPVAGVKITVNGGSPMNPRQAQMVLSAQAIGANISPEDIEAARAVTAR